MTVPATNLINFFETVANNPSITHTNKQKILAIKSLIPLDKPIIDNVYLSILAYLQKTLITLQPSSVEDEYETTPQAEYLSQLNHSIMLPPDNFLFSQFNSLLTFIEKDSETAKNFSTLCWLNRLSTSDTFAFLNKESHFSYVSPKNDGQLYPVFAGTFENQIITLNQILDSGTHDITAGKIKSLINSFKKEHDLLSLISLVSHIEHFLQQVSWYKTYTPVEKQLLAWVKTKKQELFQFKPAFKILADLNQLNSDKSQVFSLGLKNNLSQNTFDPLAVLESTSEATLNILLTENKHSELAILQNIHVLRSIPKKPDDSPISIIGQIEKLLTQEAPQPWYQKIFGQSISVQDQLNQWIKKTKAALPQLKNKFDMLDKINKTITQPNQVAVVNKNSGQSTNYYRINSDAGLSMSYSLLSNSNDIFQNQIKILIEIIKPGNTPLEQYQKIHYLYNQLTNTSGASLLPIMGYVEKLIDLTPAPSRLRSSRLIQFFKKLSPAAEQQLVLSQWVDQTKKLLPQFDATFKLLQLANKAVQDESTVATLDGYIQITDTGLIQQQPTTNFATQKQKLMTLINNYLKSDEPKHAEQAEILLGLINDEIFKELPALVVAVSRTLAGANKTKQHRVYLSPLTQPSPGCFIAQGQLCTLLWNWVEESKKLVNIENTTILQPQPEARSSDASKAVLRDKAESEIIIQDPSGKQQTYTFNDYSIVLESSAVSDKKQDGNIALLLQRIEIYIKEQEQHYSNKHFAKKIKAILLSPIAEDSAQVFAVINELAATYYQSPFKQGVLREILFRWLDSNRSSQGNSYEVSIDGSQISLSSTVRPKQTYTFKVVATLKKVGQQVLEAPAAIIETVQAKPSTTAGLLVQAVSSENSTNNLNILTPGQSFLNSPVTSPGHRTAPFFDSIKVNNPCGNSLDSPLCQHSCRNPVS